MKWLRAGANNGHVEPTTRIDVSSRVAAPSRSIGSLGEIARSSVGIADEIVDKIREHEARMQTPEFWREVWGVAS